MTIDQFYGLVERSPLSPEEATRRADIKIRREREFEVAIRLSPETDDD